MLRSPACLARAGDSLLPRASNVSETFAPIAAEAHALENAAGSEKPKRWVVSFTEVFFSGSVIRAAHKPSELDDDWAMNSGCCNATGLHRTWMGAV